MDEITISFNTLLNTIMMFGIPGAVTAYLIRQFEKRAAAREEREIQRELDRTKREDKDRMERIKHEFLILQTVNAALALSEATARVLINSDIIDEKARKDVEKALDYAEKVKDERTDFDNLQSIENLNNPDRGD